VTDDPKLVADVVEAAERAIDEPMCESGLFRAVEALRASRQPQRCEPKLLPCPFCGGRARAGFGSRGDYWVECASCGASTKILSAQEEADRLWNSRHSPATPLQQVEVTDEAISDFVGDLVEAGKIPDDLDDHFFTFEAVILAALYHFKSPQPAELTAAQILDIAGDELRGSDHRYVVDQPIIDFARAIIAKSQGRA